MNTSDRSKIKQVVDDLQIPPQPEILVKINNLLQQEQPDINRIANLISKDVATSASVLKLINSPWFNLQKEVLNLRQAALYIGVNGLVTLVKAMLLKQAFLQEHCCLALGRFWDTADEVAQTAIEINQHLDLMLPKDDLFILSLFHDAGIPVIASTFSDYKQTLIDANNSVTELITDIELRRYGTHHANIGNIMARSWNLPAHICFVILKHHDHEYWFSSTDRQQAKLNAVFQLAESIVQKARRGKESIDWLYAKEYVKIELNLTEQELLELYDKISESEN